MSQCATDLEPNLRAADAPSPPSYASCIGRSLLISSAIALGLTVVLPLTSAFENWDELSLGFGELLRAIVLAFAVVYGALAGLSLLLSALLRERGVALLTALALALFAQSMLLVWDYGSFDGAAVEWDAHFGKGLLELALWLALFAWAVLRPRGLFREARWIGALLLVLLAGVVATSYWQHAPLAARAAGAAAGEGGGDLASRDVEAMQSLVDFSPESNVLVIVLDMLQSDFFAELLADPEFAATVSPGFTYYRNAVSLYPRTRLSLQSILTSRALDSPLPLMEWQGMQMRDALPNRLMGQGYHVALASISTHNLSCNYTNFAYTCLRMPVLRLLLEDHAAGESVAAARRAEASSLLGVALFRSSPHFAKPWVYDGGELLRPGHRIEHSSAGGEDLRVHEQTRQDLAVLRALTRRVTGTALHPTFRFLHFNGPHLPNTIGADCAWTPPVEHSDEILDGRRRAVAASSCFLSQVFGLLQRLDDAGVYDASLIFVVSDHGHPRYPVDASLAVPALEDVPAPRAGQGIPIPNPGAGVPLFLVKRPGARHPLSVSDRSVSLCDIPNSVFAELGLRENLSCESIFSANRDRREPRRHYRFGRELDAGDQRYEFVEFTVEGHSWLESSWVRSARGSAGRTGVVR